MRQFIFIIVMFITQVAYSQSVRSMNEKSANDYLKAEAQLKKIFRQIMDSIPPQENKVRVALQKSEEAWLNFRKREGEYVSALYGAGSMMDYYYYTALKQMTLDRIKQLKRNEL